MTNTMQSAPVLDQFAKWELVLRGPGTWAHHKSDNGREHYYIARNPHSQHAISLCKTIIAPMKNLSHPLSDLQCMVCALYVQMGKEATDKQADRVSSDDEQDPTQPE